LASFVDCIRAGFAFPGLNPLMREIEKPEIGDQLAEIGAAMRQLTPDP
jgi:hypothetical protein